MPQLEQSDAPRLTDADFLVLLPVQFLVLFCFMSFYLLTRSLCHRCFFIRFVFKRRRGFSPQRESIPSASSLLAWIILSMGLPSFLFLFIRVVCAGSTIYINVTLSRGVCRNVSTKKDESAHSDLSFLYQIRLADLIII